MSLAGFMGRMAGHVISGDSLSSLKNKPINIDVLSMEDYIDLVITLP